MNRPALRVGIGYDVHRLASGIPLVLGGVPVAHDRGPEAHSDGDVLAHAIGDALLGAAALGDLGTHFSDRDPRWREISSLALLDRIRALLTERRASLVNVDATVIAEAIGVPVAVVPGDPANLKLTEPSDWIVLQALLDAGLGGSLARTVQRSA